MTKINGCDRWSEGMSLMKLCKHTKTPCLSLYTSQEKRDLLITITSKLELSTFLYAILIFKSETNISIFFYLCTADNNSPLLVRAAPGIRSDEQLALYFSAGLRHVLQRPFFGSAGDVFSFGSEIISIVNAGSISSNVS